MSPRTLLAATVALLTGFPARSFVTVSTQLDYGEQLQIFENSKVCSNAIEPSANRLASCTALIEEGKKGNLDATMVAQALNMPCGEAVSRHRATLLAVENSGDDAVGMTDGQTADEVDRFFVGSPRWWNWGAAGHF